MENINTGLQCIKFVFSTRILYGVDPGFSADCSCVGSVMDWPLISKFLPAGMSLYYLRVSPSVPAQLSTLMRRPNKTILQTTFSNAFSQMKIIDFHPNFSENYFQRSNWQYSSIGLDDGLASIRQQAIICNSDDYFTDTYIGHSTSFLPAYIRICELFAQEYDLLFSPKKTACILFSGRSRRCSYPPPLYMNNVSLK